MVEQIEEPTERGIGRVAQPFPSVLRDVKREGAIRAQQTEQPHLKTRRPSVLAGLERGKRSGRKREIGILPEPHGLIDRAQRLTPPWLGVVEALDPPQRLVKVVAVRRFGQRGQKRYRIGLAPHCGIHRLISPRLCDRKTVSVNELIET